MDKVLAGELTCTWKVLLLILHTLLCCDFLLQENSIWETYVTNHHCKIVVMGETAIRYADGLKLSKMAFKYSYDVCQGSVLF